MGIEIFSANNKVLLLSCSYTTFDEFMQKSQLQNTNIPTQQLFLNYWKIDECRTILLWLQSLNFKDEHLQDIATNFINGLKQCIYKKWDVIIG